MKWGEGKLTIKFRAMFRRCSISLCFGQFYVQYKNLIGYPIMSPDHRITSPVSAHWLCEKRVLFKMGSVQGGFCPGWVMSGMGYVRNGLYLPIH